MRCQMHCLILQPSHIWIGRASFFLLFEVFLGGKHLVDDGINHYVNVFLEHFEVPEGIAGLLRDQLTIRAHQVRDARPGSNR